MSHVVEIKVQIDDLDALQAAAERLGLELVRGQDTFRWYGRHVGDYPLPAGFTVEDMGHCQHAIRVPGDDRAYEVGVVRSRTGSGWTLLYDHWSGGKGMSEHVGSRCEKLVQAYSVERVRKVARRSHRVTEQQQEDGSIRLLLSRR